jgi:hypothetical protein
MRMTAVSIAVLSLLLSLPVCAAKLIYAPPPPEMPDVQLEQDGTPRKPALTATPSRGQLLYENHCMGCHESVIHIRTRQQVKSLPALRAEVARWATNARLPWGKEDVEEVVRHLNDRHYQFQPY